MSMNAQGRPNSPTTLKTAEKLEVGFREQTRSIGQRPAVNSSEGFFSSDPSDAGVRSDGFYATRGKRVFDLILALLLLPVVVLIICLLCALVRLKGGPGLFSQMRVGRGGRLFRCWKIRTMRQDAEQSIEEILEQEPELREEWEKDQKLQDDPRVTRFGSFLRKTSLDELPQIWNVIRGDMSLVGPRPVLPEELERYGARAPSYFAVSPGITGVWQVSGRNSVSYDERVEMDVLYARTVNFATDAALIVSTVREVFRRTGR
ncbi:MAG: sugar transferase [Marinosulfonomonas sp.]